MNKIVNYALLSRLGVIAVTAGLVSGALLPSSLLAQTYESASRVNFAGQVTAVNVSGNSITAQVQWLYGVTGATNTTTGQTATLPIAYRFCTGQTVTAIIPAGVKIISFNGTALSLSQVVVGSYFNATASYKNGVATVKTIRFTQGVPNQPKPPASFTATGKTLSSTPSTTAPAGTGLANFAGKVTAVNPSANSFSTQVQWFYGATTNTSQTQGLAIAAHMCPSTSITIVVSSGTKLINYNGKTITLAQVPIGAYFNGTVSWSNSVFTASTIRLSTKVPSQPASPTTATPATAPATAPTTGGTTQTPPPPPTTTCGFWKKFSGQCPTSTLTTTPTTANVSDAIDTPLAVTATPPSSCGFWTRLISGC